jgi:hypothetical protein
MTFFSPLNTFLGIAKLRVFKRKNRLLLEIFHVPESTHVIVAMSLEEYIIATKYIALTQ